MNCVVADGGPLIALAKLELLELPRRTFGRFWFRKLCWMNAVSKSTAVLIDEARGRREAAKLGVKVVGVCGLLLFAKREGWIAEVAPLLDHLRISGYYISPALRESVLLQSGEA